MASKVRLTLATGDYDRTRALWDGGVAAEGLDLNVILLPIEEIFFRMARYQEFDACEMSMASYFISKSRGTPRFAAVPAFPSRKFRHADIYINPKGRIRRPEDLKGGRIGCPEYQMTATVWVRGILQEFYGVEATGVEWLTGGTERPGREERLHLTLPPQFNVHPIPGDTTLFEMLKRNEIDAVFTARVPSPFVRGEEWIARLFPDSRQVEAAYYQQTGFFPIMHLVVLREDVFNQHPWAAQSLYKAYCQAKDLCFERHLTAAALTVTLPWFVNELDDTFARLGRDFWSYGVPKNKAMIEKFLQYMREQGLLPPDFKPAVEDLFTPNTQSAFGV